MNIIANSCVGGYIYKNELKTNYANPFIWALVDFDSMFHMITHFNTINFGAFDIKQDSKDTYSIIIDNAITVRYIHYKYDKTVHGVKTRDINVFSDKIWVYVVNKYVSRVRRMILDNENPVFVFANWFDPPETTLSYAQLKQLNELNRDDIICAVDELLPEFSNIRQVLREKTRKIYNVGLAKTVYNAITNTVIS